jgi:hypothetical protein
MFRRLSLAVAGGFLFAAVTGGVAVAAQPFAECGDPGAELNPPGFDSGGFAKAELVYAGSDNSHSNPDNWHAVSQYDIACVHYTAAHGG